MMIKSIVLLILTPIVLFGHKLQIITNVDKPEMFIGKELFTNIDLNKKEITLNEGVYNISLCKENFKCEERKIYIENDLKIEINLKPIKATLFVNIPENAFLKINDESITTFPVVFYEEKKVKIEVTKNGYESIISEIDMKLGETVIQNYELKAIQSSLSVKGTEENAIIKLNGKKIGVKNVDKYPLSIGKYFISVEKTGYIPFEKETDVFKEPAFINYSLKRNPQNLKLDLGGSYSYGLLLGGVPEVNIALTQDKFVHNVDLFYVLNFLNDDYPEYYGISFGSNYIIKNYKNFDFYTGLDMIFSHYLDDVSDYNLMGVGLNIGTTYDFNNNFQTPLKLKFEIKNRLHYVYDDDFYNFAVKLSLYYTF